MQIITHRGLEPARKEFFAESSYEAFADHLRRGFGIEFDPNFIKDDRIVIAHDKSMSRITNGTDTRIFSDLSPEEIPRIALGNGRLCFIEELLPLMEASTGAIHALHLKGSFQEQRYIDLLLAYLEQYPHVLNRIVIFDVKPEIAAYIKALNPAILLAPSVAHPYDIQRYNNAVLGTLISLEEAIRYKNIYDWVWLDEWDLNDKNGAKQFYTEQTFATLKNAGYLIALVTPELHGTSPGLLGGEAHPHAKNHRVLMARIKKIIALKPDALCTDYPEEVRQMV